MAVVAFFVAAALEVFPVTARDLVAALGPLVAEAFDFTPDQRDGRT